MSTRHSAPFDLNKPLGAGAVALVVVTLACALLRTDTAGDRPFETRGLKQ